MNILGGFLSNELVYGLRNDIAPREDLYLLANLRSFFPPDGNVRFLSTNSTFIPEADTMNRDGCVMHIDGSTT